MRKAAHRQHVGKLCRKARVRIGRLFVEQLGPVDGLHAEEGRIVRSLAMDEGNQTLIGKFLFATIRNRNFGGALQRNIALVCSERMSRKAFYQASTFNATN